MRACSFTWFAASGVGLSVKAFSTSAILCSACLITWVEVLLYLEICWESIILAWDLNESHTVSNGAVSLLTRKRNSRSSPAPSKSGATDSQKGLSLQA